MVKLGPNEQEPDRRTAWWSRPVGRPWTGRPSSHWDTRVGKSGGDRGKDAGLTLGEVSRGHSSP